MSILFSTFAVEIKITFSPPETRLIGTYMINITLQTYCSDADIQLQAYKALEAVIDKYLTEIHLTPLSQYEYCIHSNIAPVFVGIDILKEIYDLTESDSNLQHYFLTSITIKRETSC